MLKSLFAAIQSRRHSKRANVDHRFCVQSVQPTDTGEFKECDSEIISAADIKSLWSEISDRLDAGLVVTDVRNMLGGTPVFQVRKPYVMAEDPHVHWQMHAVGIVFGTDGLCKVHELRGRPVRFVTKLGCLTPPQ